MPKSPQYSISRSILLAFNFVFIISLFFSLLASFITPSSFSYFSLFGLMYPPLLIVNFLFVVLWALLKSKKLFYSLLMILVGFGQIDNNFQFTFSSNSEDKDGLHVLTYNVQRFGMDADAASFRQNKQKVTDFLINQNPDIVCLQEFHGKGSTLYEPLQKTKTLLGAHSYYYESYFNPRYQQLTGLVIFTRHKAINKGKLKFKGTRTFGIYTDVLINTDTIRVFNIHLASIQLRPSDIDFVVNPGQNQDEMGSQAMKIYSKLIKAYQLREKQMGHLVKELKNCPFPVVLAGDFNDTPSSYVYRQITSLLEDSFCEQGSGFSITYAGRLPFLRIDYVMKSEDFETSFYQRHKVDYSDHYPVSTRLAPQE